MHWAVKGAVMANFGAVKGPEGAVVSGKRSREGLARPGNPGRNANGIALSVRIGSQSLFIVIKQKNRMKKGAQNIECERGYARSGARNGLYLIVADPGCLSRIRLFFGIRIRPSFIPDPDPTNKRRENLN
jgi:hypothetical protein